LLLRHLIPSASDQEIQPKECCCRCTESDNNYTFRVKRIQGQIDEPICAHDDQSQGANQVDLSAHAASPLNASVDQERLCPLPTLVGATLRYKARLGSRNFITFLRTHIAALAKSSFGPRGGLDIKKQKENAAPPNAQNKRMSGSNKHGSFVRRVNQRRDKLSELRTMVSDHAQL
jgi:hypothetical protein